jgi:hypothetical protein
LHVRAKREVIGYQHFTYTLRTCCEFSSLYLASPGRQQHLLLYAAGVGYYGEWHNT